MYVGNLISGSSAFSKSSLNILKFLAHVLLKPGLENFEHYFTSMWYEWICAAVWTFFGIGLKTDLFQSYGHCWVFQICLHIECSTFTAACFRIWNISTGIPSPPLALFVVMLPEAHFTFHSRMSDFRWVITPWWLSGSLRSFLYNSSIKLIMFNFLKASRNLVEAIFILDWLSDISYIFMNFLVKLICSLHFITATWNEFPLLHLNSVDIFYSSEFIHFL